MIVAELNNNKHINMLFFCREIYKIHVDQLAVGTMLVSFI